ncbi:hypothetical protein [Aliikangiella coralliicola]|uniref:Uncharacterized protein n=1 Tax=Aliikangiella coralliicola TaxID=2592383 RepID=A0A545U084_9GAMM|nr:hypothetical protein [Aliikangiella coralliicola]TQV82878.1 hypothetical protein FLL46_24215 [Aliikangiella coralliicola]
MLSPKMMKKNQELLVEANERIEELENCMAMTEVNFENYVEMKQEEVKQKDKQIEELKHLVERLKQEAQTHAMEARTQRSTVLEIYQALGIQKGTWNGARPIIEKFGS